MIDLELACACSREDIARLSDEELLVLADVVGDEIGEPIVRASDREVAIANRLATDLDADFLEDLDEYSEIELRVLDVDANDADEIQASIDGVTRRMNDRSMTSAVAYLTTALSAFATIGRRVVRDRLISLGVLDDRGRGSGGIHVAASLSQADSAAMAKLAGNQTFWIGEYWSKHLSSRIAATVRRESLERGLGRSEVGRILRGVVTGDFPSVSVPGTFRGSSDDYFRMLSGTVRNHASTFGALSGLSAAEFDRYRIVAVNDERTSDVCKEMHGRTFKVSTGVRQMNATFLADDPEAVKNVAGWRGLDEVRMAAGDGDARSQEAGLAAAGLALPPYHASCRTTIAPE